MHDNDDFIHACVYVLNYLITITNVKVTVLLREQLCGYFQLNSLPGNILFLTLDWDFF